MARSRLEDLRAELDDWRSRFDHLRVQANLGKRELRDKLDELGRELDPPYQRARKTLESLAKEGADEARTLAASLRAGWEELYRTYRERREESERDAEA